MLDLNFKWNVSFVCSNKHLLSTYTVQNTVQDADSTLIINNTNVQQTSHLNGKLRSNFFNKRQKYLLYHQPLCKILLVLANSLRKWFDRFENWKETPSCLQVYLENPRRDRLSELLKQFNKVLRNPGTT